MTWTPYGPPPADMQHKTMRDITPAEAYRLASPAQRRQWFGDDLPTKAAGQYGPGQDPGLQAAIASGRRAQALGFGYDQADGNVCPLCRMTAPTETKGLRCRHRPGPVEQAQQRAWQRTAEKTVLFQQAQQHQGGAALIVDWRSETEVMSLRAELLSLFDQL